MKKRTPRLQTLLAQFSYDHRNLGSQISRIRKSAGELSRLLEDMPPRKQRSSGQDD